MNMHESLFLYKVFVIKTYEWSDSCFLTYNNQISAYYCYTVYNVTGICFPCATIYLFMQMMFAVTASATCSSVVFDCLWFWIASNNLH